MRLACDTTQFRNQPQIWRAQVLVERLAQQFPVEMKRAVADEDSRRACLKPRIDTRPSRNGWAESVPSVSRRLARIMQDQIKQ